PQEQRIGVRLENVGTTLLTGNDPETGDYFAARFLPKTPSDQAAAGSEKAVFLVDVSLSSNPDRFNIWLKLLERVLEKNRGSLKEFAVLFFNVESFWWKQEFTANTPENVELLMDRCRVLALEGATDLNRAIDEATAPRWAKDANSSWDLFLMSDGAANWGETDLYAMSKLLKDRESGALFAYATGLAGTDSRTLSHLTRESGGAFFSVVGEQQIDKAAVAHRMRPWVIEDVSLAGGRDLMLAGRPTTLFPGQRLTLVGRGRPDVENAKIALKLRRGKQERTVEVGFDHAVKSDLTARVYGQVATAQLEDLKSAAEDAARAYACHFRVTGQTCSLLMLESEEDYKRYNIKPEEDAFVVKANPAAAKVELTLTEAAETLSDPKADFLAWLEKMEETPGVTFKTSAAFRLAVKSLPSEAFQVKSPALACLHRDWESVPGDLQEMLAAKRLTYDALTKEAARRLQQSKPDDALKALSSLVENNPGDMVLLRDVGYSAMEWRLGGQAYYLLRRVAQRRPYEPQTYWGMAQCLHDMGQTDLALLYYEVALTGQWDQRFGQFHHILTTDYLRFLRSATKSETEIRLRDYAEARLRTLSKQVGAPTSDLVVTIAWNTDGSDVDMHVIDPHGEHCYYSHPTTKMGGKLTQDVTQGYGPEMFTLPNASPGPYRIKVKYFSSDSNRATARTKVYATVYRNWGRPDESVTRKVVTLSYGKEMHDVETVIIKK
ncbi:MAG: DUF2135 domain-containing protein, partial [Planctomycetales bacterium]